MRLSRRILLCAVCAAPVLFVAACLSPTLPLPPPAVPEVQQMSQGEYRLSGTIPVPGTVLVFDERSALISGKVVRDFYTIDVAAQPGDAMRVWYESGNDVSDYAEFVIDANRMLPDAGAPSATGTDARSK
jgi:hypothetical protein